MEWRLPWQRASALPCCCLRRHNSGTGAAGRNASISAITIPLDGFRRGRANESPRYYDRDREAPADYSRAPGPSQKKPEATSTIVVMGDANADWLAYGLEEAFSENPEIGIVRKHRTDSGLIRYDGRRDSEWAQVAREIITAEKPKFIVMMVGNNDRQQIRERAPPAVRPGAAKQTAQPATPSPPTVPASPTPPADPEQQVPEQSAAAEQPRAAPEQARQAGPFEFRSEKWEAAYLRRVDTTIAVLKGAGVPVIWVGLPSQRGSKASTDSSYLNEIYRSRAEKAGHRLCRYLGRLRRRRRPVFAAGA